MQVRKKMEQEMRIFIQMEESQQVHLSSLQTLICSLLGVWTDHFVTTLKLKNGTGRQVHWHVVKQKKKMRKMKKAFAALTFTPAFLSLLVAYLSVPLLLMMKMMMTMILILCNS